ncbi:hypothetical protein GC105_12835 [Alkalibaculum sp. M08DMB]|uniref:O-antigen ligase-related domain-containing protein n=1 Tax=Alkalibaculum sporogenes TaxID=2655001 RepID=A0A6A7KBF3_9FIRM|nr:O-antigen ligase family protein [Alkalibaculum sporogenes]MPW26675.1 hypothetical protein [Alkalibaculum sporogenes]
MLDIGILATIGTPYLAVIPSIVTSYIIYKRKIPIILNPFNLGMILLFFWSFYSGLINKSTYSTLGSFGILMFLSLNIYLQHILSSESKVEVFLLKVWKYSLIAGVLGIVEKIASLFYDMTWISDLFYKGPYIPSIENYRIYSTFGNPNVAGAWFAAMVLLSFYLFEQSTDKNRITRLISIVVFILALISTGSRGATLGLEFAILVYAIFMKNKKSRVLLICTFGIVLMLALLSPEINHSLNSRDDIWLQSINLFLQKPLTGFGMFGILDNIQKTHSHNIWISMLAMFGIVGFGLYLWIKLYIFKSFIMLYRQGIKSLPLLASIQALVIGHGVVDFVMMTPQGGLIFFATSSIIIGLSKKYAVYPELVFEDMGYYRRLNYKKNQ